MTQANMVGEALSLSRIERAWMAHVRNWLPTYLREAERLEVFEPDGVTPLVVGSLPLPRSYRPAERVDKWAEDQLPALIFGSPGLSDDGPRRDGRGNYSAPWVLSLTVVASGRDDQFTRWLCGIYTVALRLLFIQHPDVEGLPVTHLTYADEAYDPLPFSRNRSLMGATLVYEVGLDGMAEAAGGPLEPSESPLDDPGPWPVVQDTELTVERNQP